jgi:lipopolysaccharide/colanic/teichoic acid biosynthesis glycosyltransferase
MPPLDITPSQYAPYPWLFAIHPEKAWLRGRSYRIAKRIMDIFLVCLALPLLLPLFALIGLLIQLDSPGAPVIFFQMRTGRGGIPFRMYKFRTMVPNAEALKEKLAPLNELQWPDFKITNDPRITRVGKFLRKTSLDEIPQLINVLRGEMSLVGPRPTSFSVQTYQLWQTERLMAIPGMTGLWQIVGRGTTEFDTRLRMDIAYIEHACLWLDIQLIARTILSVLLQRGAH